MTIKVTTLESRRQTMEATIDGEVVVRAVRWDMPSKSYDFPHHHTGDGDDQHWIIGFPNIRAVVGHDLHEIHVFYDPRLEIEAFADLIAKASR